MQTKNALHQVTTPGSAKANKPVNHFTNFLEFGGITPSKTDVILATSLVVACFGIVHLVSYLGNLWGLG